MSLEMRPTCEECQAPLVPGEAAYICSFECTFCPACSEAMGERCPNCGGELVRRPRRGGGEGRRDAPGSGASRA